MEELKSSVRDYDVNFQYTQNLKGPPHYYRISVNSQMTTSPITDAVFDVKQVFPNQRADMLKGEWHAFLESFEGIMPSQIAKTNIKVCLPDLVRSSQDFVMTAAGKCQTNDAVGHVPIAQEYRATQHAAAADPVPAGELAAKPITLHQAVHADSIGVKIDPVPLFSGQLRVLLRDEAHVPLVAGNQAGQLNAALEGWRATILFVHKA